MTSAEDKTYAAVIQITLPGMSAPETLTLTLHPPDLVAVAGVPKPLDECTLAELAAFAGELEEELWAAYRQQSLRELAEAEHVELQITLLDDSGARLAVGEQAGAEPAEDQPMQAGAETAVTGPAEETSVADGLPPEDDGAEVEPEVAAEAAVEVAESPPVETEEEATVAPAPEGVVGEPPEVAELPPAAEMAPPPGEDEVAVAGVIPEAGPDVAEEPLAATPPRRKVRIAGLRRPQGHPTPAAADILINETAFRDAQAHALSSLNREVAGMLIGPPPEKQPDGRYVVHVSDIIIAKHTRMHGASVTYTPESWRYVTDKLQERYPDDEAVIVGWYHTHPGFGIFLSGMDLFIHQNFFTQKWHIALVLDPHARKSGFFCWDRVQTAVQPYEFPWPAWAAGSW